MKIVVDTDILSTFARIRRLDILNDLFDAVLIPPSVKYELRRGRIDVRKLKHVFVKLERDELKELKKVHRGLDMGEKECYVMAKKRNLPLSSNETIVNKLCKKDNIGCFSLLMIIRFAVTEDVLTKHDAKLIVSAIEQEEHTVIKNKEEIFK